MNSDFIFNTKKYDFWPVYESINYYYPIGLDPEPPDITEPFRIYLQFKGQTAFGKLITENFYDQKVFTEKWASIGLEIGKKLNLTAIGTTYGEVPAYSFYLELSSTQAGDHTVFKQLHVAISLLGPFFTIWGVDGSSTQLNGKTYEAINVITVSPHEEYLTIFNAVYQEISARFPDYKFVPYTLHNMTIQGLSLRRTSWPMGKKGLIFHALFNALLTGYEIIRGDKYFLLNQWIRDDYDVSNDPKFILLPPDSRL